MKLSNEELKKIYYGAYSFSETKDGYLRAFQYTQQQMKYFEEASKFWYDRCMASSAKTLEFSTSATQFSFEYKIIWVGSEDTIELAIDGLISKIYYLKDLQREGMVSFDLPAGNKKPNQYRTESMKGIEEYYERLSQLYPNTPVLCITPIWRGDAPDSEVVLAGFCQRLKDICAKYPNVTVVDGYSLVPHVTEYFIDKLHPNALGSEIYGRNLVLAIREAGF